MNVVCMKIAERRYPIYPPFLTLLSPTQLLSLLCLPHTFFPTTHVPLFLSSYPPFPPPHPPPLEHRLRPTISSLHCSVENNGGGGVCPPSLACLQATEECCFPSIYREIFCCCCIDGRRGMEAEAAYPSPFSSICPSFMVGKCGRSEFCCGYIVVTVRVTSHKTCSFPLPLEMEASEDSSSPPA